MMENRTQGSHFGLPDAILENWTDVGPMDAILQNELKFRARASPLDLDHRLSCGLEYRLSFVVA